ncbi:XdhC family protein [Pseudoprimorskyibacter insulae]|uniref:Xanthine dehydrogenase subunit A n=1 Tax=Pseudoprimorskyibacter insulae TaxID=1695997 RepID=A0A2R8AQ49_9RHOB|nr:XdhC family protein [Pseudoprimorskyibacter insulae]SPF78181.1 hypothetical protein PRI8871_00774 [Pseudoprimorskyibacter insulae]
MMTLTPKRTVTSLAETMQQQGEPFAIATVIRTHGATAAKPGAKALLDRDGTLLEGWIGGGCVRAALARAAKQAVADGQPQVISLAPEETLRDRHVAPGDVVDGVRFARNGCPSKGSLEIFVEPVLPMPELCIFGSSPVSQALAALAAQFQWSVREVAPDAAAQIVPGVDRAVVVATQGKDDLAALQAAMDLPCRYIGFVASHRKWQALSDRLRGAGASDDDLARVKAPAGLAIGAVTPDEIALSILAELTQLRRTAQRAAS